MPDGEPIYSRPLTQLCVKSCRVWCAPYPLSPPKPLQAQAKDRLPSGWTWSAPRKSLCSLMGADARQCAWAFLVYFPNGIFSCGALIQYLVYLVLIVINFFKGWLISTSKLRLLCALITFPWLHPIVMNSKWARNWQRWSHIMSWKQVEIFIQKIEATSNTTKPPPLVLA